MTNQWPTKVPERELSDISKDMSKLNGQIRKLQAENAALLRERTNLVAWESRVALAEFFSKFGPTTPPKFKRRKATYGTDDGEFIYTASNGKQITIHIRYTSHYTYQTRAYQYKVEIDVMVSDLGSVITSSSSLKTVPARTRDQAARDKDWDQLIAGVPSCWKRLVNRYTKEHHQKWSQIN